MDEFGARMKSYESRERLLPVIPKIIRIDGKSFGSFLSDCKGHFSANVISAQVSAAKAVLAEIGGTAKFAYIQSDECSIVINDAITERTQSWFGGNIQKVCSVAASVFTAHFNKHYCVSSNYSKFAYFDARTFALPNFIEVVNNILWRQKDAKRNSINKYARLHFSHNELVEKSCHEILELLEKKGNNGWKDLPLWAQRGIIVSSDFVDWSMPDLTFDSAVSYLTPKFYAPDQPTDANQKPIQRECSKPLTSPTGGEF